MKEIILALSVSQLLTCGQEEVHVPDKLLILDDGINFGKFFLILQLCSENSFNVAARAELGEFVEYDLDNEDDDWLSEFNEERKILTPEM